MTVKAKVLQGVSTEAERSSARTASLHSCFPGQQSCWLSAISLFPAKAPQGPEMPC